MAAPLVALCKGCRDVRDQARLYMDRVNIWEMQGNARSVQDVHVGIPAVCVWLAADKYVEPSHPDWATQKSPDRTCNGLLGFPHKSLIMQ